MPIGPGRSGIAQLITEVISSNITVNLINFFMVISFNGIINVNSIDDSKNNTVN